MEAAGRGPARDPVAEHQGLGQERWAWGGLRLVGLHACRKHPLGCAVLGTT